VKEKLLVVVVSARATGAGIWNVNKKGMSMTEMSCRVVAPLF
jgi:hypothetical protein